MALINNLAKIEAILKPYYGFIEVVGQLGGRIEFCRTAVQYKPGVYEKISAADRAALEELRANYLPDVGWYSF